MSDSKGKDFAKKNNAVWRLTSAKEGANYNVEELLNELLVGYLAMADELEKRESSKNLRLTRSKLDKIKNMGCCISKINKKLKGKRNQDGRSSKMSEVSMNDSNNIDEDF